MFRVESPLANSPARALAPPTPDYLRLAVQKSAERLKRGTIDVVLLHNPGVSTVERGGATGVLQELRDTRKIGTWGVSAGNREVAVAAIEAGAGVLSVAYNVFRSHDLSVVAAEVAMRGVAVLAHSVLAYGLLASHWGPELQCRWRRNGETIPTSFGGLDLGVSVMQGSNNTLLSYVAEKVLGMPKSF